MRKRITSLFLVLALCLTLLPTTALAEEAGAAQETQDSIEVGDGYTIEEDTAVQGKGENDKAVQTVQALIDALPAAEDISDANADEVSGQLDAIDEAKQALTEEQAAQLDFAKYDAAAAAVLALAGEPDANEPVLLAAIAGTKPGGSGTADAPYQITGAAELIWLRDAVNAGEANTCAELQQDVEYVDEVWTPIGTSKYPYTGTFNGNGHTIRVWLDGWGRALFGYVGAGAKLTDIAVTKRQSENYSLNASAPLALINDGTITHCWYRGGMTAKGSLGGLVYTNNGTIEACYVYAGELGGSRIEMYYGGWAGGIAYENTGTIANSYFYGDIAQAQSGGTVRDIIGWGAITYKNSSTVSNCYYGADSDDGYGGKTKDQFRGGEVTYLLNGGTARDDWRQNRYAGDDTPVLDRSHAQVRKSGDYYVSLYPHVHCICGGGTTSGGHPQHSNVTYTAWTDDEAASQYGASSYTAANSLPKKPGKYYLTSDVTLRDTGTWHPADGTVLCLNGQTVREFAFDTPAYDVITVDSGVTFSLTECASIQGYIYCASRRGVHTVNNSGTFNFYNGRLRDTKSKADGAAVYNTGTFNMYGGIISNNGTTARGGGVFNAGTCNLYGGTITNNGTGGGVYNNGTLTVGGTATVTGNSPNVYLAGGTTITLNSALDESARIGITAEMQSSLTDTAASIIVVKGGAAALNCFFPDDDGTYDLSYNDKDDVILHLIRDHTHCACAHKAKYAKDIGNHTEHVDHEFVAWTDELVKKQYGSDTTLTATTALPKLAGCYYLTGDVTPAKAWWAADGTIICMNGYKIVSAGAIGSTVRVDSNVHVVLTDCKASGSISATRATGAAGLGFDSGAQNGIADIFGVSFSGTSSGVACNTGNTVNLYNSTISGTTSAIYNTGTVNIAGTVKATSDTVGSGRYCVNNLGTLHVDGTLTADGGNIGVANRKESNGSRSGTITVDGTLTSTGDNTGLSNLGTLTVNGALTATGKGTATLASGLFNNGGTLTVTGTLTAAGNTSGRSTYGLYNTGEGTVTVNGTFTASGGEYAVYNFGPLNMAGTVNANKNVYLGTGRTITVVGELADASSIPIQTAATPEAGSPVVIATTENADWIKAGSFVSWTPGKYAVSRIDEGKTVVLRGHEHDWSYTLGSDGTAISAECRNADGLCGNPNGGSVTIAPPSGELIYDGSAKAARLTKTGWTAADVGEITYQKDGNALSAVPVDAGTYTASITLGEGNKAATASVKYTIQRADPKASDFTFAVPSPLTYDGNAKTATVKPNTGINGMGAVTVKYFKNGAETEPKDAGDYTVKVSVAEGANYNATTDNLTTDGWKFTIGKATQTITVPTDKTIVKGGIAEDISDWATVAGVTGGSNPGTLSYVLDDQAPEGVSLTGNQLTVQLTCTAAQFTIKVTAEETGNYNKEEQTFTVKVADKNTATVTITGLPDTVTYGQEFTLTASQTGDTTGANKKWTWDYDREYFKLVGPNANTETITLQAIKAGTPSKGITATYESGTHKGSKTVTPGVAQKEVTVSGITAADKVYDGNNSATVNASTATITGKVDGDDLTVSVAAGSTFNSADAGSRTVTLGTLTLGGTSAGNYTLATAGNQTEAAANITARDLTVKPNSGQSKSYGTTPDPVLAYTSTGTVTGETAAFDGALSREAGEDVGQYDITKGSLELKDSGTFKATNYNLVLDTAVVTFEITKVTYGGSAPTKTVNILKNYAGVQTGTLTAADFFTTAPAEAKITNAVPNAASSNMMSIAGADSSGNFTYDSKTNITAASDESWTVTISSKNYTDINATLTFKLVDKTGVSGSITFADGTLTYNGAGQKYEKATISGVSGGTWTYTYTAATGTTASLDSTGLPLTAGTYTVTAVYEDDNNYGTANATLTINKATPTGTPTYTAITTSGKTLTDAALGIGSITPAGGTITWDAGNATVVAANTAYGWTYTPTDAANYNKLTGSITPYVVSSSGGGGGGSSAATPSVSDKVAKELKNAKEGSTVAIDMKGETKLPASVTKEIAGKDVTVELDMGGGTVWSFNGLDVPKGGVRLDLGVKTGTKTIPAKVINALTGEATTIQLQLDHNGPFGMSLKLSVDLGKKHDGLYANLYFYNPKSGELEFQSASMISGGKASWAFDHASDCAIVIDKESHEPMTFIDVPDSAYYAEAVNWAVAKKITGGVGNGLFAPNDPCTRAQIVTFLWRAAGSPVVNYAMNMTDVAEDAYYGEAVRWALSEGITTGTGDGKFSPDATCNRAQSVTFLFRAIGKIVDSKAEFSDVLTDSYYANAVAWAVENGITNGIGDGLFGPDNSCTRAQIVTFLFRAYQGK